MYFQNGKTNPDQITRNTTNASLKRFVFAASILSATIIYGTNETVQEKVNSGVIGTINYISDAYKKVINSPKK